jgi:cell division septation protein DedD
MLKYGALLFNTIALLIYQFFFTEGITVTQNIPASAKAESEFTVELTINKGTTSGFAKLQQDLPEGFTATQDDNNGASFTFSGQAVKFIWMSLPSDKEFKIKYKVKVAAGVSGDKIIGGKFSYVTDNVKQSVDIAPSTIKIEGGAVAAETKTPVTNDNTASNTTTTPTDNTAVNTQATTPGEPSSIVCERKIPDNINGDFTVELNINKGNISGFAKLVETLPTGFTATGGELQGASFSFNDSDGKVKFVWVSMPTVPEFKISYKVHPAAAPAGIIEGVFSYIENDETKKYVIPASTIGSGSTQPLATNTVTNTTTTSTTPVTTPDTTKKPEIVKTETVTPPAETTQTKTTQDNATKSLSATNIPSPQGNVNYRVQIAALHNPVDANKLASRFNINQKIDLEMAEGFTKYLVGAHGEYKSARDARETIKQKGVNDAFVTAYNTGKRITVQEALMITAQKWYR